MTTPQDKVQRTSPSPQPKTAQQTTYRYLNTQMNSMSSNKKWSHSPYTAKTPARDSLLSHKQRVMLEGFSIKGMEQPSILPVSFDQKVYLQNGSEESLMSVTQVQRLKLRVMYLEEQLTISRQQNQQIMRQKKTINENYIQLINKQIEGEQQKHQQLAKMKLNHAQQLNHYSHQLSACSQAVSRLQLEKLKYQEELQIQLRLFRDRQTNLIDTINNLQAKVNQLKNQTHNLLLRIRDYESIVTKKQAQIQQLQNQSAIHIKNINLHKAEYQSLMKILTSAQTQNHSLQSQNHSLNHMITQLQSQLTIKDSNISKMSQEITVLLKIDHQSHHQLAIKEQTIHNLQQQYHSLNLSYSQLVTSSEQSITALKHNEQSFITEITTLKLLQSKLREQNTTLIKHIQNLKDRQSLLIESQKNAREKLTTHMQKKNKQIQDLCLENQRLYKEINKIKFSPHSGMVGNNNNTGTQQQNIAMGDTQSSFIQGFNQSR